MGILKYVLTMNSEFGLLSSFSDLVLSGERVYAAVLHAYFLHEQLERLCRAVFYHIVTRGWLDNVAIFAPIMKINKYYFFYNY